MAFARTLKTARKIAELTQEDLADKSGISLRTIQAWETGKHPHVVEDVSKVITVLAAAPDAMLSKSDRCVIEAYEKGGARAAREVEGLINEVDEQFAGRNIDEQEKEGIAVALCEAY